MITPQAQGSQCFFEKLLAFSKGCMILSMSPELRLLG